MAAAVTRTTNLDFFLARADQARVEGEAATLSHVRERCLRSEAAWSALADKARWGERMRAKEQERKAAKAASIINEDRFEEQVSAADIGPSEHRTP